MKRRTRRIMRRAGADTFLGTEPAVVLEPCGHVVEAAGDWRQKRRCRACEAERARREREWITRGQSEFCRRLRLSMGMPEPAINNQGGRDV